MTVQQKLTALITSANEVTGETATDVTNAIGHLIDGYGGSTTQEHGVFFVDYDGSVVESWDSASVASKTALPNNPSHTGLVAQGWNWELNSIKSYVQKHPFSKVWVGQMYDTQTGDSEFDIVLTPVTGLEVKFNAVGERDWGDGTTDITQTHTYSNYGKYTIKWGNGSQTTPGKSIFEGTDASEGCCVAIRIGHKLTRTTTDNFNNMYALETVTLHDSITCDSDSYLFAGDSLLKCVIIPNSFTEIPQGCFEWYATRIETISLPDTITEIKNNAFKDCAALENLTIPESCQTIGEGAFSNCPNLYELFIPDSITELYTDTFKGCFGLVYYDFTDKNNYPIPEILSDTFGYFCPSAKIIVPDDLYSEWIEETNWSNYVNYIYKESEVER